MSTPLVLVLVLVRIPVLVHPPPLLVLPLAPPPLVPTLVPALVPTLSPTPPSGRACAFSAPKAGTKNLGARICGIA